MISSDTFSLTDAEQTRFAKVQVLREKGSDKISDLLEMLTDPSWMVRRSVVEALAHSGDLAVKLLVQLLCENRGSEARIAAVVDTLSASNGHVEEIMSPLADHSDPAIVADVAQIFGRRGAPTAVQTLVKLTKHSDDNVAVGAIEALGKIGGRAAVEALIEIVNGKNFFRVFPAIDVLGRSGDPRAVAPLTKLLSDPVYLPEACRALGRSGERTALIPLIGLLKNAIDGVILVAATSIWELYEKYGEKSGGDLLEFDFTLRTEIKKEMVRRLLGVLPRSQSAEAVAICNILGIIGDAESVPGLTQALQSEGAIAMGAAVALKKIGSDAESTLLTTIKNSSSERRKILIPLVTRSSSALDIANCLKDTDPEIRALASDTLVRLGNPIVIASLFPLLEDENLRVVHAATATIQALGSHETLQLAVIAANSKNPVVRRSAIRILSYFGDSSALVPTIAGLADSDPRVQEAAIHGLPFIDSPEALEALFKMTKNATDRLRALAMRSLGQLSNPEEKVFATLINGLSDRDSWTRYYSCQSLGRLKYDQAAIHIAKLLDDEAGQVRVAAVEALSHFQSSVAHDALKTAAEKSDIEVRRAAMIGLGLVRKIETLPLLLTAIKSADPATRLVALSAAANFPTERVLGSLSAAASDSDAQISNSAIHLLGARQEQEATEVLVELLPNQKLSDRVKAALLLPSNGRVSGILVALESAHHELAAVLISILAKLPKLEARSALLAAIRLHNVAARKAAAPVLAARKDPEMLHALQEAVENDPDHEVRQICSLLLHR